MCRLLRVVTTTGGSSKSGLKTGSNTLKDEARGALIIAVHKTAYKTVPEVG